MAVKLEDGGGVRRVDGLGQLAADADALRPLVQATLDALQERELDGEHVPADPSLQGLRGLGEAVRHVVLVALGPRWGRRRPGVWVHLDCGPLGRAKVAPLHGAPDRRLEAYRPAGVRVQGVQVTAGPWGAPLVSITLEADPVQDRVVHPEPVDVPELQAQLRVHAGHVLNRSRAALGTLRAELVGQAIAHHLREQLLLAGVPEWTPIRVTVTAVPGTGPAVRIWPEDGQLQLLPLGDHGWTPEVEITRLGKRVLVNVALRAP